MTELAANALPLHASTRGAPRLGALRKPVRAPRIPRPSQPIQLSDSDFELEDPSPPSRVRLVPPPLRRPVTAVHVTRDSATRTIELSASDLEPVESASPTPRPRAGIRTRTKLVLLLCPAIVLGVLTLAYPTGDGSNTPTQDLGSPAQPTRIESSQAAVVSFKHAVVDNFKHAVVDNSKHAVVDNSKRAVVDNSKSAAAANSKRAVVANSKHAAVANPKSAVAANSKRAVVVNTKPKHKPSSGGRHSSNTPGAGEFDTWL